MHVEFQEAKAVGLQTIADFICPVPSFLFFFFAFLLSFALYQTLALVEFMNGMQVEDEDAKLLGDWCTIVVCKMLSVDNIVTLFSALLQVFLIFQDYIYN